MYKNMNIDELIAVAVDENPDALLELSDRYHKGINGVELDETKAYAYAIKAVAVGNYEGIARIADYYSKGKAGLVKNDVAAKKLLIEGEANNSIRCLQRIAHNYNNGECGYEKDEAKAIEYCQKIIQHPTEDKNIKGYAYTAVGSVFENGKLGVEPDIKKALTFYQKAARLDYAFAFILLGNIKYSLIKNDLTELSTLDLTQVSRDDELVLKSNIETIKENLKLINDMYSKAHSLALIDADKPVSDCAKAYAYKLVPDFDLINSIIKKLSLKDADEYSDTEVAPLETITIQLGEFEEDDDTGFSVDNSEVEEISENPDVFDEYSKDSTNDGKPSTIDKIKEFASNVWGKVKDWAKKPNVKLGLKIASFALGCVVIALIVVLIIVNANK